MQTCYQANSYFSVASGKTDSSRDTAKNNRFTHDSRSHVCDAPSSGVKMKEFCQDKKIDREFLARVYELLLRVARLSASVERRAKLGYECNGELTLYKAIPTSQLHAGIVLISYVVSCRAFRAS